MDETLRGVLSEFASLHLMLASRVPAPIFVEMSGRRRFRYATKGSEQAIVQKLAYATSALSATGLLLDGGFVQESAALGRVLDDLDEEVRFLSKAVLVGEPDETPAEDDAIGRGVVKAMALRKKLLDNFYDETIGDPTDVMGSLLKKRAVVRRAELREATERLDAKLFAGVDIPHVTRHIRAASVLFNGYVHGGSPQIMETYGGNPPHFHLFGLLGTPLMEPHTVSCWQRIERTAMGFSLAGAALELPNVTARASALLDQVIRPHLEKLYDSLGNDQ